MSASKNQWPSFNQANMEAWEKAAAKSAPNGNVDA